MSLSNVQVALYDSAERRRREDRKRTERQTNALSNERVDVIMSDQTTPSIRAAQQCPPSLACNHDATNRAEHLVLM